MYDISPIHAFSDNFIWLMRARHGGRGVVVDPGDARPVLERLNAEGMELAAILVTHKHADHVGGIRELRAHYGDIPVYGPAHEPIPEITHRLSDGDRVVLEAVEAEFDVLDVPGHTAGHIAYVDESSDQPALFCGDTLFSVGCGRVFSGTHQQLHESLMRIADLPPDTLAYCAHEYTLENIGFAKWVEPGNPALLEREQQAFEQLDKGGDTVPSTIATERATNPFLRVREDSVIAAAVRYAGRPMRDSGDTFRTIRIWKDSEYD